MSRRTEKVASTIQRSLQTILGRGLNDPRVRGLITITKVEVTEDLTRAVVFVSVLPEKHQALTLHGLQSAANYLRRQTGTMMAIRRLPAFFFEIDRGLKREAEVLRALEKVRQERIDKGLEPLMEAEEDAAVEEALRRKPAHTSSPATHDNTGADNTEAGVDQP